MRPTDTDPAQQELEALLDDEERLLLAQPNVPEEVKAEIATRLERFREDDLEVERGDEANAPQ
ncbi:MAG: hypothetical protein WCC84_02290 [Candidatus Cybelea sp.]